MTFGLIIFSFAAAQDMKGMDMSKKENTKQPQQVTYTCPMHPQIHANKPGNCPICGMKLVKEKTKVMAQPILQKPAEIPKDTSKPKPVNKGNKDSMQLGDMKMHANSDSVQPTTYTCPMHSQIHATRPGNCPICGMKLIKEKSKTVVKPSTDKPGELQMSMKATSGKMDNMKMQDTSSMNMGNMEMPKVNVGPVKTIINNTPPHTVRYDLYIADTMVNFSGKTKRAIAVNGQIPMPTLIFTEGDTAEIWVHNELNEETSLHWHGLMLPNQYDGVPNLTQMPIKPHTTHVYKFPIIQHGTHWYHSHTQLQEQIGMYGAFIMNKRQEWDIPTLPVVLSEWTDMRPKEVHRSLHNATDWFAIKKGTTQSYAEAINSGYLKTKLTNEWKRMNAMDVSDVAYDKFLINGKSASSWNPLSGGRGAVRLRIANAGASSYFWLTYSGGKITVVATDGNDVEPVEVDRLIIAVSETYDVIVTIPENKSYEFLVTPEDRTRSASLWLGSGDKVPATKLPKLKYFDGMKMMNSMMAMNGDLMSMGMNMSNQIMDMNTVMYPEVTGEEKTKDENKKDTMQDMNMGNETPDIITLNYTMLRSPTKTSLPKDAPIKELKFDLTGNMNRYVWSLDNKVVSESDKILIKKGENVRIILFNNSMMRHPMHLHGHDFRLLNGQGEYAPLKNIIDIMPMERDTIEFAATESGDWFFHCHILYHMMSGMGRIFSYENSPVNPEIPDPKLAQRKLFSDDRMAHFMAKVGIEYNGSDGEAMFAQTRWKISTLWHLGYHDMHGYESETMVGRYLGRMQWLYPYVGFDYHYKIEGGPKNIFGSEAKNWFGQTSNKNNRKTIAAGIAYTLPMLFIADARIDGDGKFRFQFSREDIPITSRLRFNMLINTDKEYMAGFRYIVSKYLALSTHYDSDMGLGAGITFTY